MFGYWKRQALEFKCRHKLLRGLLDFERDRHYRHVASIGRGHCRWMAKLAGRAATIRRLGEEIRGGDLLLRAARDRVAMWATDNAELQQEFEAAEDVAVGLRTELTRVTEQRDQAWRGIAGARNAFNCIGYGYIGEYNRVVDCEPSSVEVTIGPAEACCEAELAKGETDENGQGG